MLDCICAKCVILLKYSYYYIVAILTSALFVNNLLKFIQVQFAAYYNTVGWLVVLRLNVPVNNFSVMSGRSHRFLGN